MSDFKGYISKRESRIMKTRQELSEYFGELSKRHVPASGKAKTIGGEIVRAICWIRYRYDTYRDYANYGGGSEQL